jgi:hypothetical protein
MKKIFMLAAFTFVMLLSGCLGFGGGAWGSAPYYDDNNQGIYQQGRYRDRNQDRNQRQDQQRRQGSSSAPRTESRSAS